MPFSPFDEEWLFAEGEKPSAPFFRKSILAAIGAADFGANEPKRVGDLLVCPSGKPDAITVIFNLPFFKRSS